jgi:hypothetical protein
MKLDPGDWATWWIGRAIAAAVIGLLCAVAWALGWR